MSPRTRRLLAPLTVGALTLGATAYVGLVDPGEPGHYPLCPTKALTGLDCPACGGLRAVHALAHGDLVGALDHNAYVVLVLLPLAVVAWTVWVVRAWRGSTPHAPTPEPAAEQYAEIGATGVAHHDGPRAVEPPPAQAAAPPALTGWSDPRLMWALLAIALVFTVVRNIDAVPALQWLGSGVGLA